MHIIILHDITWHFLREFNTNKIHFTATQMYLMACLHGDKLLIKNNEGIENIGAVYLYKIYYILMLVQKLPNTFDYYNIFWHIKNLKSII